VKPLWYRVWTKVTIGARHECWNWTGAYASKRKRGDWQMRRPSVRIGGRKTHATNPARLICEWFHGAPPSPVHEAGHTCPQGENECCVNPDHLKWMTREENERYKHANVTVKGVRAPAEEDDQTRSVRVDLHAEHHDRQLAEGAADEAGPFG
jgi:hypothetical protein